MSTQDTLPIEQERERFEAWCVATLNYGYDFSKDAEGDYSHDATETAWFAWEGRAAIAAQAQQAQGVAEAGERQIAGISISKQGPGEFSVQTPDLWFSVDAHDDAESNYCGELVCTLECLWLAAAPQAEPQTPCQGCQTPRACQYNGCAAEHAAAEPQPEPLSSSQIDDAICQADAPPEEAGTWARYHAVAEAIQRACANKWGIKLSGIGTKGGK